MATQEPVEMTLFGKWFWWDGAPTQLRHVYHGTFSADLGGGYYLLRFDDHEKLARGTQEVVHINKMVEESWSVFDTAEELRAALVAEVA